MTTTSAPLANLKVLDLSRMFPGAFCTLLLADLGADVLKVEAPGFGDGMRAMAAPGAFNASHVGLNRGKRSMTLDTRKPGAVEVLRRLVRGADILVESAKPGSMDANGIGFAALRQENPGLIWCSLSGFGQSGPNVEAPGHDITYLGYSGLLSRLGTDTPPVPAAALSLPINALMGAVGILSAVAARAQTGVGSFVDANMVDSAMWAISHEVAQAIVAPGPGWGTSAARCVYKCADGKWVTVAASEARSWAKLCEALELTSEGADGGALAMNNPNALDVLKAAFARKPAADWVRHPGLLGGVGPVNEPVDLVTDPQVTGRGSIVRLADGASVLANPLRLDGESGDAATNARSAPPQLGEHTEKALAAAGFSADEIAALRTDGVV